MREKMISIFFMAAALILFSNLVLGTTTISIGSVSIPSSATQGDSFTITMSVSEGTVGTTEDVSGSLSLPSGISCTPSGSQTISLSSGSGSASWSCTASVAGDYSSQITASVTAKDSDTKASLSDTEQTGLIILSPASLAASSTLSGSSVVVGNSVIFTVGVNNVGDSSTTFNISITCPTGLSCSSDVGNTAISGQSLSNNQFTINGDTVGSYTIIATVKSPVQSSLTTSQTLTVTASATTTTVAGGAGGLGSGSTTTETGKVTKTYSYILAGGEKTITSDDLDATGTKLTELSISVINRVNSVSVTIEKLPGQPADVTVEVSGRTYKYISITKSNLNDSNINKVMIKFKVEKIWVSNNSIDVNTIALYRYSNGWVKLNTTKLSEDSTNYYFQAESPGMSYFVISGISTVATTTTQPAGATTTVPSATTTTVAAAGGVGAGTMTITILVIVIIVLIVIGFLLFKPKKSS